MNVIENIPLKIQKQNHKSFHFHSKTQKQLLLPSPNDSLACDVSNIAVRLFAGIRFVKRIVSNFRLEEFMLSMKIKANKAATYFEATISCGGYCCNPTSSRGRAVKASD